MRMEKPAWKVRSSSRIIDSPFYHVRKDEVELPDGSVLGDYYVRESTGFTMVFAVTSERNVVLIHEFRYGINSVLLECPAGTVDDDERPLACAQRELREETGYSATRWEQLFALPSEPSRSDSIMRAFLALDASLTGNTERDRSEHMETVLCPLEQLETTLAHARGEGSTSVATLTTVYAALARLRELGIM
jgi:ADP-ribose pyrophosphatase